MSGLSRRFCGRNYVRPHVQMTLNEGVADWMGAFETGLPHGEFKIVWGDQISGSVWFDHGVKVDDRNETKQGTQDEV